MLFNVHKNWIQLNVVLHLHGNAFENVEKSIVKYTKGE